MSHGITMVESVHLRLFPEVLTVPVTSHMWSKLRTSAQGEMYDQQREGHDRTAFDILNRRKTALVFQDPYEVYMVLDLIDKELTLHGPGGAGNGSYCRSLTKLREAIQHAHPCPDYRPYVWHAHP